VQGVGFEPALVRSGRRFDLDQTKWRYHRYTGLFAVSFPFFFLKKIVVCINRSLIGDEKYEQKTRNQRVGFEIFAGDEMPDPSAREVSTMWMQTFVEKWTQRRTFWNAATLFLQRMRITLYKMVITFLFFLSRNSISKLFKEDYF
jgi:hypothetical protein